MEGLGVRLPTQLIVNGRLSQVFVMPIPDPININLLGQKMIVS